VEGKYGMFHLKKSGKIVYELHTLEEILNPHTVAGMDEVLLIKSQRYIACEDDQSNKLLLLIKPKLEQKQNMFNMVNGSIQSVHIINFNLEKK
jgi:hypothetical protein